MGQLLAELHVTIKRWLPVDGNGPTAGRCGIIRERADAKITNTQRVTWPEHGHPRPA